MHFHRFYLDTLAQASFLLADGDEAAVVDPRRDVDEYLAFAAQHGLRIRWALSTHVHADFVAGLTELHAATGAEIVLGSRFDGELSCRRLDDGEQLRIGTTTVRAIATPGHTPESVCYLLRTEGQPQRLLSGDTLFLGDVGRPDLVAARGLTPAAMAAELWHSLHERLASLPDAVEVWPGHGAGSACGTNISCEASSPLGVQRLGNWAFSVRDPAAFAAQLVQNQRPAPGYFANAAALNRRGPVLRADLPAPQQFDAAATTRAIAAGALLLDVRSNVQHGRGHWPGALNIGLQGDFEPWSGALIEPGRAIIVHSLDEAGAQEAWTRLLRVGHEHVPGWTSALPTPPATQPQLQVSELFARLQSAGADWQVIDVRRPAEYAAGHVAGAAHAELSPALASQPVLQRLDRQRPTAVVCRGGYRSSAATHFLRAAGFRHLHNVLGGMSAWQGSELPVER